MNKQFTKFLILWPGSFVAAIGNGLTSFGLGVYVYEETGLASATMFIMLLGLLPSLLLSPLANASLDYLVRTNIINEVQGRIWGLVGIIFQIGLVFAYGILGPLGDYVFIPMFKNGGVLENSIGKIIGVGEGRGIGFLVIISGVLLSIISLILPKIKSIKELEPENNHV